MLERVNMKRGLELSGKHVPLWCYIDTREVESWRSLSKIDEKWGGAPTQARRVAVGNVCHNVAD